MTQIMYPLDKAHEALDAFLDHEGGECRHVERWIADENGNALAFITPAESHGKTLNGYHHWLEAQEVVGEDPEDIAPEHGYKPWRHSPLASVDRMLPTEPLQDPLARMFYQKPYDELGSDEQSRVRVAAACALLRVTLDPDGQGAVPVMVAGHEGDEPGVGLRWQLAFVTKVPGLYVRVTANGFFGEEFGIVTGSGFRVASGWHSRDDATGCAEALGRTLPNTDWMRLTPRAFTPRALEAIRAVLRRYRPFGINEREPEPEVMADPVPAEGGPCAVSPASEHPADSPAA